MNKKSLLDIFEIERKKKQIDNVSDYDVFSDKDLLDEIRTKIVENLIDKEIPKEYLNDFINDEIDTITSGYDLSDLERNHLYNLIDNEINGYGPITELLNSKNVTEIMVNSPHDIYIETDGKIVKDESVSFINEEHIYRTIRRLIEPLGRTINSAHPMVDSRLLDGSRINAIIPPLSVKGPVMTIRKFIDTKEGMDDLLRMGTLTPYMARFLESAVKAKLNIIIVGAAGSGKTTLLNILSSFIGEDERIITIEDAAELKLRQNHVISLETRVNNYENSDEVTIRDLIINSLRMRPDRIIIGEVRGKEAFDMLQAMNTGHNGSLTTMHGSSKEDALNRLEAMVLMNGLDIPIKAIREYILNAIDLIVCIDRLSDGKRKITSISELDGFNKENIKLKEIFKFSQKGLTDGGEVNGEYILLDGIPNVYKKIVSRGITDLDDMFRK